MATRTLATSAFAALGLTTSHESEARKKKKKKKKKTCKKPLIPCGLVGKGKSKPCCEVCISGRFCAESCKFSETATVWTLQNNCTTTGTIELPPGVSLDGNGNTIDIAGEVSAYNGAIIRGSGGGNLTNLRVGRGFINVCGLANPPSIIRWGSGAIDNVILRAPICSTVLDLTGPGTVSVTNCDIGPGHTGVALSAGINATFEGNTIEAENCGIAIAADAGAVTFGANQISSGTQQPVCDDRQ